MKRALFLSMMLATACASRPRDDEAAVPAPSPAQLQQSTAIEARLAEMQTSMTELLERIDVLNSRLSAAEQAMAQTGAAQPPQGRLTPSRRAPESSRMADAVSAPSTVSQSPALSRPLQSADIAETYRTALMLFGRGKLEESRRVFQQVFDADRSGELADNALYWIGETYLAAGKYGEAMKYYRRVTTEFSEANRAPDALFKIAVAFEKQGDLGVARTTLEEVIQRYPFSTPAAAAKLELKRIRY